MTNPTILVTTHTSRWTYPLVLFPTLIAMTSAMLAPQSLIGSIGSLCRPPSRLHLLYVPLPKVPQVSLPLSGSSYHV